MVGYGIRQIRTVYLVGFTALLLAGSGVKGFAAQSPGEEHGLQITVNPADGRYDVAMPKSHSYALRAGVGVELDGRWLHASDYPRHVVKHSQVQGYLGEATDWQVSYSGLSGQPDLVYHLRAYSREPFGDIQVTVRNTTGKEIHLESIRCLDATEGPIIDLGGPVLEDRVLSDSFSEDRPAITIRNFADAEQQLHRAVGSQLIYNRQSHQSLFLGALTSDRFLTILRLHLAKSGGNEPRPAAYEVDSTGTTEMEKDNSLRRSPLEDQVQLSLPVAPGAELSSERLLFSLATDYHRQLETYGSLIGQIHHARTSAPALMGWWSWTAYYFGLNEGAALTNAEWEAQHLKPLGYNIFHIDEGYQYARGEYSTPNATLFPQGLATLEDAVRSLGLVPGIWTSPFQVSERSWVYEHHPDWLVKNAKGQPIHAGSVQRKDRLFVLDTTNPEAQEYLRKTYSTLVDEWGIRYIKMDFMDDSGIEGYYFKPNTTAMEAQRLGLKIIRETVGDNVYLDKDGSAMLNPVGYVDYGRISLDTGHTFDASREAAPGIAARYFMNRNYFVADPDAFTVSTQTIEDHPWHESSTPATMDEARVSIALAAVSGGMFEIGDDLPSLSKTPERLALIENSDLIQMVRLGKASIPLDLMNFTDENQQPSVFFLKEEDRQSILSVFNWTDKEQDHSIDLTTAGLPAAGKYEVTDVLDHQVLPGPTAGVLVFHQPPHSVRMLKIVDTHIPAVAPLFSTEHPSSAIAGATLGFAAHSRAGNTALSYHWDFGDGVSQEGTPVHHAYTEPGEYDVHLTATGLSGLTADDHFQLHISGHMPTTFEPQNNKRYQSSR
jgi:alpha-galactosidase